MQEQSELPRLISGPDLKRNLKAMETYEKQRSARADEYLEARGLKEASDLFHLGEVVDPLPGHERYRGRLVIPYTGPGGVYTLRYRCLDCDLGVKCKGHPKYTQDSGSPTPMYGVDSLLTAGEVISACEGEADRMTLELCGYKAVGIPGANNWHPHFAAMLAGFKTVYVWADPDEAGGQLAATVKKALRTAVVVPLEDDVNETYRKYGDFALKMALEEVK